MTATNPAELPGNPPAKRSRLFRVARVLLFGSGCLLTLILLFYAVENWRGKRAWQAREKELLAQGEVLTVAGLTPPPVPDEQNFAMTPLLKPALDYYRQGGQLVWRDTNGLARLNRLNAETRAGTEDEGKLVLGNLDKGTFADLAACQQFYRGNTNYPQPVRPGTPAEDVLVALSAFDSELRELREAMTTRPLTRFPVEYEYEPSWGILLPHLARLKMLVVITQVRATALLEAGRADEAFTDLKLGLRLAEALRNDPILINHLVRIAMLNLNLQVIREGLKRHAWNEAQLAELEKYLAPINMLAEYRQGMRGELALGTGGLDFLRRQGFGRQINDFVGEDEGLNSGGWQLMPSGWYYQNMLTISRLHQDLIMKAVDAERHLVSSAKADEMNEALTHIPFHPYSLFARLLMPALGKAVRKAARAQVSLEEAQVALALERYRLTNGSLPENLEALVPRYLPKVPTDVMDGQPLRYKRQGDGGYLLYSIGWNQTDDGGEVALTKNKPDAPVEVTKGDWTWAIPGK